MQMAKLSPLSLASNGLDLPHDGWKVEAGIYSSIIQELSATGQPIWEARVRSVLENHCAQISLNMFRLIFSLIVLFLSRMGIPASSFSCAVKSPSCKQRSKLPFWVGGYAIWYTKLPTTNLGMSNMFALPAAAHKEGWSFWIICLLQEWRGSSSLTLPWFCRSFLPIHASFSGEFLLAFSPYPIPNLSKHSSAVLFPSSVSMYLYDMDNILSSIWGLLWEA